jgi:mono/diheme cytochrome c family protein
MSLRWTIGLGVFVLAASAAVGWSLRQTAISAVDPHVVNRGRLLFQTQCAICHGNEGHGDGPAAGELEPPPRDFAGRVWRFDAEPATLRRVIVEGIPGSTMPGSPQLAEADVDALIAYIRTLAPADTSPEPLTAEVRTVIEAAGLRPIERPGLAPGLDVRDLMGQRQTLGSLQGKWVLVAFWGTACEFCLEELPSLERLAKAVPDLVVLPVCADEPDAEAARVAGSPHVQSLRLFVSPDGTLAPRYEATVLPRAVLIDPWGRLVARSSGTRDWSESEVVEAMKRLPQ